MDFLLPIPCVARKLPRPDFVAAGNGIVKATVSGNAAFGLNEDQTMLMIAASTPRGSIRKGSRYFTVWF
jgi:hypothetical protein